MSDWDEYLAAANAVEERIAAGQRDQEQLTEVRVRLAAQRDTLTRLSERAGTRPPSLTPSAQELTDARRGGLPAARSALDEAEVVLGDVAAELDAGGGVPVLRNALVYGGYALLTLVVQVGVFVGFSETSAVSVLAMPCSLLLPFVAFGMGWLTVAMLPGPRDDEGGTSHSAGLGMAISALSALPLLLLIVWLVIRAVTS